MGKLIITTTYGVTPNHILNDPNLSMKAKGLFAYMQSKPDRWTFSIGRISRQTKEQKEAIQSGINELENAGFLRRKPYRNDKGEWSGYDYVLTENPLTDNPSTDNPSTENPVTLSKKEVSKKEYSKKESRGRPPENQSLVTSQKKEDKVISEARINEGITLLAKIFPSSLKTIFSRPVERKKVKAILETYSYETLEKVVDGYAELIKTDKFAPKKDNPSFFLSDFDGIKAYVDANGPYQKTSVGVKPGPMEHWKYWGALSHDADTPLLNAVTRDIINEHNLTKKSYEWIRLAIYLSACSLIKFWWEGDKVSKDMEEFYTNAIKFHFWDLYNEGQYDSTEVGERVVWEKKTLDAMSFEDYEPKPYVKAHLSGKKNYQFFNHHSYE